MKFTINEKLRAPPQPEPGARVAGAPAVSAGDCGLLLLRITFGLLLAGHGCQKLFGIFGGDGIAATGRYLASLGFRPGVLYAAIGGGSEFLGGIGLALGLFTPLASAALIGVMINAMVTVTAAHGLWDTQGGVELNVCIAVVALAIAAIGPGRFALDRPFRWGKGGWTEAAFALCVGGISAAIALAL
ncbi:DoxX family protein [Streptomyces sp. NBC_01435]|uniref:DoxX family protein n=1 Tax=Streptomyces sp. NBC_01435 TaxID=2903865 RepID=UPI002E37D347|nr:DoxX family protein [Streptomyces sp. NBC_01435]